MDWEKFEQSCAIKFCVKLGESATVTYENYKGLMENIPYTGYKCSDDTSFLEGREQVENEHRAGKPSTSKMDDNVERVRSLVRSDRRLSLRMISNELNLNWFTVH